MSGISLVRVPILGRCKGRQIELYELCYKGALIMRTTTKVHKNESSGFLSKDQEKTRTFDYHDRRPQGMSEYVRIVFGMLIGLFSLALVHALWLLKTG